MKPLGVVLAVWGVGGVLALIVRALLVLTPIAVDAVRSYELTQAQWWILIVWILINGYAEGYRGFHLRFSPRVVDRGLYGGLHPTALRSVLAPAFCMGLFDAGRRTLVSSWILLGAITALVLTVRLVPQPWRGIIDAGVVAGLALGSLSIVVLFVRALATGRAPSLHDVPRAER